MRGWRWNEGVEMDNGDGSYVAQVQDAVYVALVFLHLLPEADGLFHLLRVDIFGPTPLNMVYPTAFRLEAHGVHLHKHRK